MTIPNPGPIALRAAQEAQTKEVLAVREEGNNRGKSVLAYLKSVFLGGGNPWCQAFVTYRMLKAASLIEREHEVPLSFPKSGYTPTVANWFKKKGLWIPIKDARSGKTKPQIGDWCYFYFPSKGRVAHVGIVVAVDANGVTTVEGNTSPDSKGVIREGDGVYKKYRSWNELGVFGGFARLNW